MIINAACNTSHINGPKLDNFEVYHKNDTVPFIPWQKNVLLCMLLYIISVLYSKICVYGLLNETMPYTKIS